MAWLCGQCYNKMCQCRAQCAAHAGGTPGSTESSSTTSQPSCSPATTPHIHTRPALYLRTVHSRAWKQAVGSKLRHATRCLLSRHSSKAIGSWTNSRTNCPDLAALCLRCTGVANVTLDDHTSRTPCSASKFLKTLLALGPQHTAARCCCSTARTTSTRLRWACVQHVSPQVERLLPSAYQEINPEQSLIRHAGEV